MARDSRLWQNPLAHVRIFEGDAAECNKWYAWAQQKLRFMLANHPGATSQVFVPAADVTVKVDTRPNRIHISAGSGLYMESGFYEVGWYLGNRFKPAKLWFNTAMLPAMSATNPLQGKIQLSITKASARYAPFAGEDRDSGEESQSLGCDTKVESITLEIPGRPITYTGGGYCDLLIYIRKLAMFFNPPSVFTGKTKLLVQAIYGAKRKDYSINGETSQLVIDRMTMNWDGKLTSVWLLTLKDGGYALCQVIAGSKLLITPIKLADAAVKYKLAAEQADRWDDFEYRSKIEALVLSTTTFDHEAQYTVPISGPPVLGEAIAYGWHSNWAGDSAWLTTHRASVVYDNARETTMYRLDISQVLQEDGTYELRASVTGLESGQFTSRLGQQVILRYARDTGSMSFDVDRHTSEVQYTNSPVYCYTYLDSTIGECLLGVVRGTLTMTPRVDYSYIAPTYKQIGDFISEETIVFGQDGNSGLTLTTLGAPYSTVRREVFATQRSYGYAKLESVTGEENQLVAIPYYFDTPPTWISDLGYTLSAGANNWFKNGTTNYKVAVLGQRVNYSVEFEYRSGDTDSNACFLELPFGSSETVIIGSLRDHTYHRISYTYAPFTYWGSAGLYQGTNDVGGPNEWTLTGRIMDCPGTEHLRNALPGAGGFIGGWGDVVSDTEPAEVAEYEWTIVEKVGSRGLTTVASGSDLPVGAYARYLRPTMSDLDLGVVDTVKISVQSGAVSQHTLYSSDYGYIHDISVGWA